MSEQEDIKNFTVSFFTNLKANLFWDDDRKKITITSIPESFERFYGKKAPYILVFDPNNIKKGEELIAKGSSLINSMKEFLQDKGKTTLVKIDFDFDPGNEIQKYLNLKNCQITNIIKKPSYDWLVRFTFLTTLQYLNEKEQLMNPVYVKGDNVVKFDLEKYKTLEGKKEDIQIKDIKNQYVFAKEYLKTLIEPKIIKISEILDKRLEKEIERVKHHYLNQIKEDSDNLTKSERQIMELEDQLANPQKNPNLDKEFAKIRIRRLQETIFNLKSEKRKNDLAKEEEFFLKDESNRHGLNINTQIMNTTIVYFPIYTYSTFFKNHEATRMFDIIYNPLMKDISKINCETCNREIKDIYLCSGGHIACNNCLRMCNGCQNEYCLKCLQTICFSCGNKICRKCAKRCSICGKYKCKSHMATSTHCQTCSDKASGSSLRRPNFNLRL